MLYTVTKLREKCMQHFARKTGREETAWNISAEMEG
jgi:hypothetical protein